MPTPTYTALATITLGSSTSSITFSSIPATYRDLVLVIAGSATSNNDVAIRFNGDSGNNYNSLRGLGFSGGVYTDSFSNASSTSPAASIGTAQSTIIHQIMDYSATDKHKTLVARSMIPTSDVIMGASRWANTAAITSVAITAGPTYTTGTVFSLYGIAS
jgi:hypothetical protein